MSLINTIALPLFIFFVGLILVIYVGGHIYRLVSEARTRSLMAHRDARLERQAYQFITSLVVAADTLDVTLTPEITDEMNRIYYQIDSRKELSR